MKAMTVVKEWYEEWFDSPYYHILYRHRDMVDAQVFLDGLVDKLGISPDDQILDLACGKGRHSIYLNAKGFKVTGVDLSENSIKLAKKSANDRLSFDRHDMREVFREGYFDLVLNMFTSIGYFDTLNENGKVVCQAVRNLKPGGQMVLDFMNSDRIIAGLVPNEVKSVGQIRFAISRYLQDGRIVKEISFEDQGISYQYYEKVMALREGDFRNFFEEASCDVIAVFGNYQLQPFDPSTSDRMVFLVRRRSE